MLTTARDNHGTTGIASRPELSAMLALSRAVAHAAPLPEVLDLVAAANDR